MLDVPSILLADAANIAGLEFGTLRSWIQRGSLVLAGEDQLPEGRGGRTMVTLRTVLGIAIMNELVGCGLSPNDAGSLASEVVHIGRYFGSPQKWLGPAETFPEGETLLLVFSSRKVTDPDSPDDQRILCELYNVKDPKDYAAIFGAQINPNRRASIIVVNISILFDRVYQKLADLRARRRGREEA